MGTTLRIAWPFLLAISSTRIHMTKFALVALTVTLEAFNFPAVSALISAVIFFSTIEAKVNKRGVGIRSNLCIAMLFSPVVTRKLIGFCSSFIAERGVKVMFFFLCYLPRIHFLQCHVPVPQVFRVSLSARVSLWCLWAPVDHDELSHSHDSYATMARNLTAHGALKPHIWDLFVHVEGCVSVACMLLISKVLFELPFSLMDWANLFDPLVFRRTWS